MSAAPPAAAACASAGFALTQLADFRPDELVPPVVHLKGFGSRMLLPGTGGASALPFPLKMRAQAACERERAAAGKLYDALVSDIVSAKPRTLVWDGDIFALDSFTALIPRLLQALDAGEGIHLLAFSYDENLEHKLTTWAAMLQMDANSMAAVGVPAVARPASRRLVLVPGPPRADEVVDPSVADPSHPDNKYVHLGRTALKATGSHLIFFLGGSYVSAQEARLALSDRDTLTGQPATSRTIRVAPLRRWRRPPAAEQSEGGTSMGAEAPPSDLEMEDPMVAEVEGVEVLRP